MTRRIRTGLAAALCAAGVVACSGANDFTGPGFGTDNGGVVTQPNSQAGTVSGSVSSNGQGVGGIRVLLANRDSTTTDATGRFTLANVGPASYSLSIRIPIQYELAAGEQNPRTVNVSAGQITNVNFSLRPAATTP